MIQIDFCIKTIRYFGKKDIVSNLIQSFIYYLMHIFLHTRYMCVCVCLSHTHSRVSVIIVMHSPCLKFTLDSKHNIIKLF